jgi:capsule polysaccharide export protein KpsE/RkpR
MILPPGGNMASDIDELTIQYEEEGQVLVEELDKLILNRGAWTTILFLYREWNAAAEDFSPPKAGLRRYQKSKGVFRKRDGINLTAKNVSTLIAQLQSWFKTDK